MIDSPALLISRIIFPFLLGWLSLSGCQPAGKGNAPNVIIILADDLGYGDLACYNPASLVPTPNLNRLAAEGIRLTRAYCPVSVCSPSRYGLMTGRYSWRSWKKSGVMRNYEPSMIASSITTLPEMLRQSGYKTAGFGKWHLGTTFPTLDGQKPAGYGEFRADDNGANIDLSQPVSDGPLDHGFDHWYGFSCASECWILADNAIQGAIGHDLYTIEATPNREHIEVIPLADYLPVITERSLDFLEKEAATGNRQPFFLYFAPYVPHIPLAVSEAFRGLTQAGLYGDYVHELDHYIGKLLKALDRLGLQNNTIVLFASDNGSQFPLTSNGMDLEKATNSPGDLLLQQDSFPAHHPNGKLRGTKWSIYEGGVRTPFIARWPGHFPAGRVSGQMLGLNDLMATLASVVNCDLPETQQMDSKNLLPVLQGNDQPIREEIVIQSSGKLFGIIRGKWKFVGLGDYRPPSPESPDGELYDLSTDEAETVNLYLEHPEVVEALRNRLKDLIAPEVSLKE